jgi:hypothetical protein
MKRISDRTELNGTAARAARSAMETQSLDGQIEVIDRTPSRQAVATSRRPVAGNGGPLRPEDDFSWLHRLPSIARIAGRR